MSKEELTLIAAAIAALTSFLTLLLNLRASRAAELRVSHRKTLEPFIHDLGKAIHEIVATSHILLKVTSEERLLNWRERSGNARDKLKDLRPRILYPLFGIDNGIRTLTRLPDWIEHLREYPISSQELLSKGDKLAESLDRAIRRSYASGRPPSLIDRSLVKLRDWQLRRTRERIMAIDKTLRK